MSENFKVEEGQSVLFHPTHAELSGESGAAQVPFPLLAKIETDTFTPAQFTALPRLADGNNEIPVDAGYGYEALVFIPEPKAKAGSEGGEAGNGELADLANTVQAGYLNTIQRYTLRVIHDGRGATDTLTVYEGEELTLTEGLVTVGGDQARELSLRTFDGYMVKSFDQPSLTVDDGVADAGNTITVYARYCPAIEGVPSYTVVIRHVEPGKDDRFVVTEGETVALSLGQASVEGSQTRIVPLKTFESLSFQTYSQSSFVASDDVANSSYQILIDAYYETDAVISLVPVADRQQGSTPPVGGGGAATPVGEPTQADVSLDTRKRYNIYVNHILPQEMDRFTAYEGEALSFVPGQVLIEGPDARSVDLSTFGSLAVTGYSHPELIVGDPYATVGNNIMIEVSYNAIASSQVPSGGLPVPESEEEGREGEEDSSGEVGFDTSMRFRVVVDHKIFEQTDEFLVEEGDSVDVVVGKASISGSSLHEVPLTTFPDAHFDGFSQDLLTAYHENANEENHLVTQAVYSSDAIVTISPETSGGGGGEAPGTTLNTWKRFVYDMTLQAAQPNRRFSDIRVYWSPSVERQAPHEITEHIVVRGDGPGQIPVLQLRDHVSTGAVLPSGCKVVFVGNLYAEGGEYVVDSAPLIPGAYTYRIYTRLRDPERSDVIFMEDEARIDTANLSGGTGENQDREPLSVPEVWGHGADSAACLSWNVDASAEQVAAVRIAWGSEEVTLPGHRRRARIGNLINGQSYSFTLTIYDQAGNETHSTPVEITPISGGVDRFEASGFTAAGGIQTAHLNWQFDAQEVIPGASVGSVSGAAIGFLIHRSGGGETDRLIAALPVRAGEIHYAYTDATAASNTAYTYRLTLIDRMNRRSAGQVIQVNTVDAAALESSLAVRRARFHLGESVPGFQHAGTFWTGSSLGAIPGRVEDADLPEGGAPVAVEGGVAFAVPTRNSGDQFYQTLIDPSEILTLECTVRVEGRNSANSGIELLRFKTADHGVVRSLILYQDRIEVGGQSAAFYHGGRDHRYAIRRVGNAIRLAIDGNELLLSNPSTGSGVEGTESGNAFLRFGARSENTGLTAVFSSLAYLSGVSDYFEMKEPAVETALPQAVADIAIDTDSQPGSAKITWSEVENAVAYEVTLAELPALRLIVNEPAAELTPPLPLPYTLQVTPITTYGNRAEAGVGTPLQTRAAVAGSVLNFTRVQDFDNAFYRRGPGSEITESHDWIHLAAGSALLSPVRFEGADVWSLELTFALRPDTTG
ncbi:MAG: hypothetical protein ACYTGH_15555, partial [Planctomycetota bacterium]